MAPTLPHDSRLTALMLVGGLRQVRGVATRLRSLCSSLRALRGPHLAQVRDRCAAPHLVRRFTRRASDDELLMMLDLGGASNAAEAFAGACEQGRERLVAAMLADPRVDPAASTTVGVRNKGVRAASFSGHTQVVRLLLADPRVDPSIDDNVCIRLAAEFGHAEVVRLLLAHPFVDPTADDNNAFHEGVEKGHIEVVRLLLADSRVNPAVDRNLALRNATLWGEVELVDLLLAHPRVNSRLHEGTRRAIRKVATAQREVAPWAAFIQQPDLLSGITTNGATLTELTETLRDFTKAFLQHTRSLLILQSIFQQ